MLGYAFCLLAAAAALQVAAVPSQQPQPLASGETPLYRQSVDDDQYLLTTFATPLSQCRAPDSNGQSCNLTAFTVCNMTEVGAEGCSYANISSNEIVNIVPGGDTHCLNDTAEYYFQVMPANPKKLLIWFYGGGACWNSNISGAGACAGYPGGPDYTYFVSINPHTQTGGFFNRSDDDAPFHEYTMVALPYCSGDLFIGDLVRVYKNETTNETIAEARQSGSNNTMSVLDWTFANFPNITNLLIGGCSAGSLGAQAWSPYIYKHYNETMAGNVPKTAVLADGYAGIFPNNQKDLITQYNGFKSPWALTLPLDYQERMANSSLYWCEITNYFQDSMPNVAFAASQAAHDITQLSYFNVLASTADKNYTHGPTTPACANESVPVYDEATMGPAFFLSPEGFFNTTNTMYEGYITRGVNNFVPFIVNTTQHCFLGYDNIYSKYIIDFKTGRNVSLVEWLEDIPHVDDTDTDKGTGDLPEIETFPARCDAELACVPIVANNNISYTD